MIIILLALSARKIYLIQTLNYIDKPTQILYSKTMTTNLLKFGKPNAKLKALADRFNLTLITFSLPSGFTCPFARDCLSKANRETGKITDGPDTEFRCFQASAEALYPSLRKMVWHNFELLKQWLGSPDAMADLIQVSLPKKFDILRVHVGGDFFSQTYFDAWVEMARRMPDKIFYAYTKSLPYWIHGRDSSYPFPDNFVLTASRGGKKDELIERHILKCAEVVFSEQEAIDKGLEIDHDDSHAAFGTESFALLLHGMQPKGSKAGEALKELKRQGKGGYNKKKLALVA